MRTKTFKIIQFQRAQKLVATLQFLSKQLFFFPKNPTKLFASVRVVKFLCSRTRSALQFTTFIAFSFSCPFLILLELNVFFFLLFFPGERRYHETFLNLGLSIMPNTEWWVDEITAEIFYTQKQPKNHRKVLERKKSFGAENFESWAFVGKKRVEQFIQLASFAKKTWTKNELIHVTPKSFIHFISMFFKHKRYTTSSFILSHQTAVRELYTFRRAAVKEKKYINCVKLHLKNVSQSPISSTNLYQRRHFFPSVEEKTIKTRIYTQIQSQLIK